MIRNCQPSDASQVCAIYNHYVDTSVATFEEQPVPEEEMARRIAAVTQLYPWLVREEAGTLVGYAYAARWKERASYRYSVETAIYLAPGCTHRGIGTQLYEALFAGLRSHGLHCAIAGISLPNPASVALHEKLGFFKIGEFKQVGWKFGRWVDVGYWQLAL